MNFYQVLEVSEQADGEQIKQSYRRLAKKYHPDLNPGDEEAEKRFKDVVDAYEVLGDSEKRKAYDESRRQTTGTKKAYATHSPGQDMGNFTKDMESFFGFSFSEEKGNMKQENTNAKKTNPIDVTEMFEAFMKIK